MKTAFIAFCLFMAPAIAAEPTQLQAGNLALLLQSYEQASEPRTEQLLALLGPLSVDNFIEGKCYVSSAPEAALFSAFGSKLRNEGALKLFAYLPVDSSGRYIAYGTLAEPDTYYYRAIRNGEIVTNQQAGDAIYQDLYAAEEATRMLGAIGSRFSKRKQQHLFRITTEGYYIGKIVSTTEPTSIIGACYFMPRVNIPVGAPMTFPDGETLLYPATEFPSGHIYIDAYQQAQRRLQEYRRAHPCLGCGEG